MYKLLDRLEKEKKDTHGKNFHEQRKTFSPLVLSVDGILGKEAIVLLSNFSSTNGRKTQGTHFTCTWMGRRPNINCSNEVLLLHDLCR